MASSVCRSLQCLISALTQGGEGGLLFRLTCSVVLWGGRNTANKYHWRVWGVLAVSRPHLDLPLLTACVLSQSILLRLQVAMQGACPGLHFPGLSCSGSSSLVLHKGADSVGPAFCAVPRYQPWFLGTPVSGMPCVSSGLLISGCDPPVDVNRPESQEVFG